MIGDYTTIEFYHRDVLLKSIRTEAPSPPVGAKVTIRDKDYLVKSTDYNLVRSNMFDIYQRIVKLDKA